MTDSAKVWALHLAVLAALVLAPFLLPPYHATNLARIMLLATFAMGYNLAFGLTGLLSLGHALFFAAGLYATGLLIAQAGLPATLALPAGVAAGAAMAFLVGLLALRTTGTAFMIVTLMFAQVGYLAILYFGAITRGDEGFTIPRAARSLGPLDLSLDGPRYALALALFALGLLASLALVRSPTGRVLIAVRENAERTRMLGYDPFRYRLLALTLSGLYAGAAGAAYALAFGYVGASFAGVQYSILPLLWVLLGGAGTILGPLLGTALMFYLLDLAARVTDATLFVVGVALILLVFFAPRGLLGTLRAKSPAMAAVTLLEARGLTRHFGGVHAVEHVDFDLAPGEIHALIGPNGAGKTTFVSLISGRLMPNEGHIRFAGREITRLPAHARVRLGIAYTFQITSIYPRLPVFDNVALAVQRTVQRTVQRDLTAGAFAALAHVGLEDRAREPAGTLAYGHQRLLEIAMGLALAPKLLILDEPTQGLAPGEIDAFKLLVREIALTATVLLIEHNMDVVMDLAHRITVLDFGRTLATGDPATIRANPAVRAAYLGP